MRGVCTRVRVDVRYHEGVLSWVPRVRQVIEVVIDRLLEEVRWSVRKQILSHQIQSSSSRSRFLPYYVS
jgi:hypothetical protein